MFLYVLKKMFNNRLMTIYLLIGFILVVAMISSIPIYTNGIMQKMLIGDLEESQSRGERNPGYFSFNLDFKYFEKEKIIEAYDSFSSNLYSSLAPGLNLPILSDSQELYISDYSVLPESVREDNPKRRFIQLLTKPDLQNRIKISHGQLFSNKITNNTVEIIASKGFLFKNNLLLNDILLIEKPNSDLFTRFKIVGVFTPKNYQDTYWPGEISRDSIYMDFNLYKTRFLKKKIPLLKGVNWDLALDYHEISINSIDSIISTLEEYQERTLQYSSFLKIDFAGEKILKEYDLREKQLRITLWIIEAPVLILLFFYIFMITNLIIKNEQTEIAVLKSRGKSTKNVFNIYLLESFILSGIALLFGPPLGYYICKVIGSSDGFLEFVRRAPLEISLSGSAYIYSLITLVFLIIAMMLPTYFATKRSIVQTKQEKAREFGTAVWKRFFFDIQLLLFSGYGFYRYNSQKNIMNITGTEGTDIGIDPILFLTSTLFILGLGLLILRFFPAFIRFIFRLGEQKWSPTLYCALLQVSRSGKNAQFLMLFLIFSIAIGIFDANMSRTLNQNIEDKTKYNIGADITLRQDWQRDVLLEETKTSEFVSGREAPTVTKTNFREPVFTPFTQLDGVKKATKVYSNIDGRAVIKGKNINNVKIQGIIPHEFGEIAWFRSDLLPYHWFNYLNLLSGSANAFLVSVDLREKHGLNVGDSISISWGSQDDLPGIIYGFIDYWPAYTPSTGTTLKNAARAESLVVTNLQYLHNKMVKEPYDVWLKKEAGATDSQVYNSLKEKNLDILRVKSTSQELIQKKNDSLLKGINGALTQGFMFIMLICTTGFLIYWILSLKSRTLQFGILRAMGLSQSKVMFIIVLEQIMVSGSSILLGIIIGTIASELFVPFLQLVFSSQSQVIPFQVVSLWEDYQKIYLIITLMLGTGMLFLRYFMGHLQIGSALKLGED